MSFFVRISIPLVFLNFNYFVKKSKFLILHIYLLLKFLVRSAIMN